MLRSAWRYQHLNMIIEYKGAGVERGGGVRGAGGGVRGAGGGHWASEHQTHGPRLNV